MNPKIRQLANTRNALDAIRQGLIRCGFELEFQRCDGQTYSDLSQDDDDNTDTDEFGIHVPNIEVGEDGSVRGGEARTIGALTPTEFMAAATALFESHDFEIDTGCSFHIHLSVPGVDHVYSKAIQAEMFAFLLQNQDRLPESVRTRLKKDSKYFEFRLDTEKYRAVHRHPQKTWEFRLFGNVSTALDAWKCLLLAIDTLRHAYQVRLQIKPSLVQIEYLDIMHKLATDSIKTGKSLKSQFRWDRVVTKKITSAA